MEENKTPEEQIKELNEAITNLAFFSDNIRFNQFLYQELVTIVEKITKIEELLKPKLPELPDGQN